MKKFLALFLVAAMGLGGFTSVPVLAAEGTTIKNEVEDGSYVIRIPVEEDDLGWAADEEAKDEAVVKLASEETVDGTYVVRYDPVADGEGTVAIRHYGRVVCDQIHTFTLKVEDGKVTEATGGSYTASPADEEMEPYVAGGWIDKEKQLSFLNIKKNEEEGFDVEITSAAEKEPYVFRGTMYYDCDLDEFIYPDGEFYKTAITDSEGEADLGDPYVTGTSGAFKIAGDEKSLNLEWYDWREEQHPEPIVFERAIPEGAVMPMGEEFDAGDVKDGIYQAAFNKEDIMNVGEGLTLGSVEIFTRDVYDIVDVNTLEVGSTIYVDGQYITIETIEKGDTVVINGGNEAENGCELKPEEESNCYVVVQLDDLNTYSSHGKTSLVINPAVVFTDASKPDAEPVVAEGFDALMKAMEETEIDTFWQYNTKIRVENGEIMEIYRIYTP